LIEVTLMLGSGILGLGHQYSGVPIQK
jgi:hypothetical protein